MSGGVGIPDRQGRGIGAGPQFPRWGSGTFRLRGEAQLGRHVLALRASSLNEDDVLPPPSRRDRKMDDPLRILQVPAFAPELHRLVAVRAEREDLHQRRDAKRLPDTPLPTRTL